MLKVLSVDGMTKVILGVTHTKNTQSGEVTAIVPPTFLTNEGHRFYYWYKMYFQKYGRECPKNYVQMVNILHQYHSIDDVLYAMVPS